MEMLKSLFGFKITHKKKELNLSFSKWCLRDDMYAEEHYKSTANLFYLLGVFPDEKGDIIDKVDNKAFLTTISRKLDDDSVKLIKNEYDTTPSEYFLDTINKTTAGEISKAFYSMIKSAVHTPEEQKKTVTENALQMTED